MSWLMNNIRDWFLSLVVRILKTGPIPGHVALVLDGNRRYAQKYNMLTGEGHLKGNEKLTDTISWCIALGVTEMTVFAFSIENFRRSKEEIDGLMNLARQTFKEMLLLEQRKKLQKDGVCIRVIGNLSLLPKDLSKIIAEVIMVTRDNKKFILNYACPYTSREDITHAIKDIAKGVKRSDILPEDVDEHLITDCLYTYKSSNPDLLIRTSGETRLSDFLMWEIADTYLYFTDVLWPEFSLWTFLVAIFHYQRCFPDLQRNRITKPIVRNSRVSMFLDKLYRERDIIPENIMTS